MNVSEKVVLGVLRKAVAYLLGTDWNEVTELVGTLSKTTLTGYERKARALSQARLMGIQCATWLLSVAIEVAVGLLKEQSAP